MNDTFCVYYKIYKDVEVICPEYRLSHSAWNDSKEIFVNLYNFLPH